MQVQIPGLAHRFKLYHTADSRTFLIFFIMRGGREDEYARKLVSGRAQVAFETAIKECLEEGGYIHQVQDTVITQLGRKLQALEGKFVPELIDQKDSSPKSDQTPMQGQPDFSSFINETKQILDQFQRTLNKNQNEYINQQKMMNLNLDKSLQSMEENLMKKMQQLEEKITKLEKY
ncbi:MAG: hypothetical protein ACW981_05340 [Candidatus Hodarchaeales archaeon]|jgi:hypothetical protein